MGYHSPLAEAATFIHLVNKTPSSMAEETIKVSVSLQINGDWTAETCILSFFIYFKKEVMNTRDSVAANLSEIWT